METLPFSYTFLVFFLPLFMTCSICLVEKRASFMHLPLQKAFLNNMFYTLSEYRPQHCFIKNQTNGDGLVSCITNIGLCELVFMWSSLVFWQYTCVRWFYTEPIAWVSCDFIFFPFDSLFLLLLFLRLLVLLFFFFAVYLVRKWLGIRSFVIEIVFEKRTLIVLLKCSNITLHVPNAWVWSKTVNPQTTAK